jgi:hypothetical protein
MPAFLSFKEECTHALFPCGAGAGADAGWDQVGRCRVRLLLYNSSLPPEPSSIGMQPTFWGPSKRAALAGVLLAVSGALAQLTNNGAKLGTVRAWRGGQPVPAEWRALRCTAPSAAALHACMD